MSDIAKIFDVVDTPAEALQQPEKVVDKRQALKDALRKGKGHLLPKKCTEGFVEKAPDDVIEKVYSEYVQREIHEKGEKTAKALSSHAISMYTNVVGNVVQLDIIIKDGMADLGILVYSAFGKFLAPLLVLAHTVNHTKLSKINK